MARPPRGDSTCTPTRSRGRPNFDTAAQIDREIVEAARELFFVKGYEGTSMAMIIKAAGVSKTTVYARYGDKAALFKATVQQTFEHIENPALTSIERQLNLAEGLEAFGRQAIAISLSPFGSNYERLVYAEGWRFPELVTAAADRVDIGVGNVSRFICECAQVDGVPCRDADAIATVYVMALRGFFSAAVLGALSPRRDEYEQFVKALVVALVAGRASW